MRIVEFSSDHLERIVALEQEVFRGQDPWSVRAFSHELDAPQGVWLVGEEGAEVAAYAGGWVLGREFQVLNFAVRPERRRAGLGRRMLDAVLAAAARRGCTSAILDVRRGNTAARDLYAKAGFREIGERPGYYSDREDAVIYELNPLG